MREKVIPVELVAINGILFYVFESELSLLGLMIGWSFLSSFIISSTKIDESNLTAETICSASSSV
jgi:hypothetical protein